MEFAQVIKQNSPSTRTAKRLSRNAQKINPCLELFLLRSWKNGITYGIKNIQMQHTAFYSFLFPQKGLPKATAAALRGNIRKTDKRSGGSSCSRMETDVQPILKIMFWPQGHPCSILTKNPTSSSWKLFYLSFCNLRQFSLWSHCQQVSITHYTIRIMNPPIPPWTYFSDKCVSYTLLYVMLMVVLYYVFLPICLAVLDK